MTADTYNPNTWRLRQEGSSRSSGAAGVTQSVLPWSKSLWKADSRGEKSTTMVIHSKKNQLGRILLLSSKHVGLFT